ncbi:MAG: hypothetical protein LW850_15070 [Planctomycetaceae bacterium]|jgi:type II secretory pathway component GspD/PulD (secretin)|nr:hypothetical protein [Planctomycetaceae bacterium]MCE2811704.1 hypothetical protein [Planctomycetaceae bacterium]
MIFRLLSRAATIVLLFVAASTIALGQTPDLARLVLPEVAERLSLSDSQRVEIQKLVQDQSTAVAAATDAVTKASTKKSFDEKIIALLTPEQKDLLAELDANRKLRFQFREMKWDDVLEWFAEQQDLTLVMDRTPPGTFTYSDARTYTPTEGIDLINSVLMTRNFSLMRRNKMLVVVELSDSLPLELIPRIKLDELASRGRFELVSVAFPLGGRPLDAVLGEVKPFLSSYGRAIPLAQGSQLLVVENAGKMQTINELIASIPVPKVPPKPEPVPPPKPVFATYPLGNLDPTAVIKTIQTLISSDNITVDPKTAVLSAYVPPDTQAVIKSIIEKMTENAHGNNLLESVAYQASKAVPEDLKKQILAIAPNAIVLTSTDRVQVTATNAEQALIRAGLIGLDITPVIDSPSMKVFEIDPALASIAETAMKAFLPRAQVGANSGAGALIVRGTERELQLATDIFEIWKKSQVNKSLQMKSFPLDRIADAKWLATVTKLVPNASLWLNPEGKELLMLAVPTDISAVESSLPTLLNLLPKPTTRELKLYVLTKNQLARRSLLAAELPADLASVKLVDGTNKEELFVWAEPTQHEMFKAFLDSLDQAVPMPAASVLKSYPLETTESTLVQTLLTSEFAEAKVTLDTEGKRLTVVAPESVQQKLADRLSAIEKELPKRPMLRLESYSVPGMSASALSTALTPLTTKARVSVDSAKDRLLITTDEPNHLEIKQLIDAMSAQATPDKQKLVVVYPIQNASPTQIKTVLDQITTGATTLADEKLKQLTVTGSIETQAFAKSTIEQMDRPRPSDGSPKEIRSFDTKKTYATYLLPLLQKIYPEVELAADSTTNRILATGTKSELDLIAKSLDRLVSSPDGTPQNIKTYPIPSGDMTTLPAILGQIAPQALISPDVTSRTVTVFATEEQHSRVAQAIEQISKTATNAKQPATYNVKPTQTTAVQTALITLFPSASVAAVPTSGQLIVVASEEQQAKIATVIKQLDNQGATGERSIRVVRVDPDRMDAPTMVNALAQSVPPQVQLEANARTQTITIVGTKEEIDQVAKKIEEVQQQLPPPEASQSIVYPLQFGNPVSAYTIISAMIPKAVVVYDITGKSVAVTAKPWEHNQVRELLKSFDAPRGDASITKIYKLKQSNAYGLATVLTAQFPTASIYGGRSDGTLIATASPVQHEKIAELVKEHDQGAVEIATRVFSLQKAESLTLRAAIAASSERITATADTTTNSLIVTAPAIEMQRVEQIVREIDTPDSVGKITKYYPLTSAEPIPMSRALAESHPKAKFSSDSVNGGIYITGNTQEHEELAKLIDEINKQPGKTPTVRTFLMQYASPDIVARAITGALGTRTTAGVSYNRDAKTVFATGTPQELQSIEQMIKVMDTPGAKDSARRLEIFSLQGIDGKSLENAIESLFKDTTGAYVQYDNVNEQLLVTGSTNQIAMVQEAIKKLAPPARTLEIFSLANNDPFAMRTAIEALFQDEPMQTAPSLSVDSSQQQLIVRATKEQFDAIKQLMQRMGENPAAASLGVNASTGIPANAPPANLENASSNAPTGQRLKTVPVNRNPKQLLEDVQRLWPLIRSNPIQIVDPKELEKPKQDGDKGASRIRSNSFLGKLISAQEYRPTQQDIDTKQSPVVVVAGDGQWTLASDDPEALVAMEKLLSTLLNPSVEPFATAGNFSVYILRHADAKQIRELLGELFRSNERRSSSASSSSALDVLQRVKIVSDARTNALVIGGNKADRKIIEELLGVFDSKDLIDRLQQITPTIIPIASASADTISDLVRDVYKSQLTSGAGRDPLDIPEGVSSEVATILQQINAQTSGPLLTMSVDETSNLIVLRGPNELTNEIKTFIDKIDQQAAGAPSRRIQVLKLESTNSKNLEKALKILSGK